MSTPQSTLPTDHKYTPNYPVESNSHIVDTSLSAEQTPPLPHLLTGVPISLIDVHGYVKSTAYLLFYSLLPLPRDPFSPLLWQILAIVLTPLRKLTKGQARRVVKVDRRQGHRRDGIWGRPLVV